MTHACSQRDAQREARWVAIRAKIDAAADLLRQGSIASRLASGRRVFSVRYFEQQAKASRRQRSIYLGTDEWVIEKARGYLCALQSQASWPDEVAAYAQFSAALCSSLRRILRRGVRATT